MSAYYTALLESDKQHLVSDILKRDAKISDLEARLAASEAGAAAMREAWLAEKDWYERALDSMAQRGEVSDGLMFQQPQVHDKAQAALASDAGRELLERLEKAEARLRTAIATCVVTGVVEVDSDETQRLRESLCHARAQALEDAEKVVEDAFDGVGPGQDHNDRIRVLAAIRALKEGGAK